MSSDDDETQQVYCICRSTDIDRFMIMCDKCLEWFHGDCIKVSSREAKYIKYFYCKTCRKKHPTLKVKYRESKKHKREPEVKERKHKQKNKSKKSHSSSNLESSSKLLEKFREHQKTKLSSKKESHEGSSSSRQSSHHRDHQRDHHRDHHRDNHRDHHRDHQHSSHKKEERPKKRLRILDDDDDDDDDFLNDNVDVKVEHDLPEKPNVNSLEVFSEVKEEIPDKAIAAAAAASLPSYEVDKPEDSPPINLKHQPIPPVVSVKKAATVTTVANKSTKQPQSNPGCGACKNCLRKEEFCDLCDVCYDIGLAKKHGLPKVKEICRQRRCLNDDTVPSFAATTSKKPISSGFKRPSSDVDYVVEKPTKKARLESKEKKEKQRQKRKQKKAEEKLRQREEQKAAKAAAAAAKLSNRRNQQRTRRNKSNNSKVKLSTSQCLALECVNSARVQSSYCSDACGRSLARARLMHILPDRIKHWNSAQPIADEIGREELERIHLRMVDEKKQLERLEQKFQRLEKIISIARLLSIDEKRHDDDENESNEIDQCNVFCPVCGQLTSVRMASKHMDRCFNKIEALTSFGSVYPTQIDGSQRLFCDVENEQQKTFCKRLKVLCPEHTKEPKITETEVCGCPLDCRNIYAPTFSLDESSFCRMSKKKCCKHYKWETMYRAEVDLQRIRQWLMIDEIFDEERKIRTAMSNRAGVLSLLLHETINHDPNCTDLRTKKTVSKKPTYRLMI